MVRLKVKYPLLIDRGESLFQFLMVRLKEIKQKISFIRLQNFNSLWCD